MRGNPNTLISQLMFKYGCPSLTSCSFAMLFIVFVRSNYQHGHQLRNDERLDRRQQAG